MMAERSRTSDSGTPTRGFPSWAVWPLAAAVAAIAFAAFLPALRDGFVNFDDDKNFLSNPFYRGLDWAQLRWMFTTFLTGPYQPLSWLTLGLDFKLWGLDPFGYHLSSLLLHALAAALACVLNIRLLKKTFPDLHDDACLPLCAAFSALLFAVHPLRVESVVWISERRDVLSGVFYLLTFLTYLSAVDTAEPQARRLRGALSLFFYAAALFSKAIGIGLPFVLLGMDILLLARLDPSPRAWFSEKGRPILYEKLPFLFLAAEGALLGWIGQRTGGSLVPLEDFGPAAHLAQCVYGLAFYLWKTIWPFALSPLYPVPAGLSPASPSVLCGFAAILILGWFILRERERRPGLLLAALAYVIFLAPVSGLVKMGSQLVADRYSYLSCFGWSVVAGGGLLCAVRPMKPAARRAAGLAAAALIAGLAGLSWRQSKIWRDGETLWKQCLALDPGSEVAQNNLGNWLMASGRREEALEHLEAALKLRPDSPFASLNLALTLADMGRLEQARARLEELVSRDPDFLLARAHLGGVLRKSGRSQEALPLLLEVLSAPDVPMDPNIAKAKAVTRVELGKMRQVRAQ